MGTEAIVFGVIFGTGLTLLTAFALINYRGGDKSLERALKAKNFRVRLYELYRVYKLKLGLKDRGVELNELLALEQLFEEDAAKISLQAIDKEWLAEQKKLDEFIDKNPNLKSKK